MDIKELMQKAFSTAKKKGWWDKGKQKSLLECMMMAVTELGEAVEELRVAGMPPIYQPAQVVTHCCTAPSPYGIAPHIVTSVVTPDNKRYLTCEYCGVLRVKGHNVVKWDPNRKPEGWVVEIADCFIRLADTCAHEKVDLVKALELKMEHNKTRAYRHGNKKY